MSAADNTQKRLLRWLQTIAVMMVIGVLAFTMLRQGFGDDGWGWQQVERDVVVKRFNQSLLMARTQWLRDGRPATVALLADQQRFDIMMNDNGWPSVANGCRRLWQMLVDAELAKARLLAPNQCQYRLKRSDQALIYDAYLGRLN